MADAASENPFQAECDQARALFQQRRQSRRTVAYNDFTSIANAADLATESSLSDMCVVGPEEIRHRCLSQGGPLIATENHPNVLYTIDQAPQIAGVCAAALDYYHDDGLVFSSFFKAYSVARNNILDQTGQLTETLGTDPRATMEDMYRTSYSVQNADDFPSDAKAVRCLSGGYVSRSATWARSWQTICRQASEAYPAVTPLTYAYGLTSFIRYENGDGDDKALLGEDLFNQAIAEGYQVPPAQLEMARTYVYEVTPAHSPVYASSRSSGSSGSSNDNSDDLIIGGLLLGGAVIIGCAIFGCFDNRSRGGGDSGRRASTGNRYADAGENRQRDYDAYDQAQRNPPYTPPPPPPQDPCSSGLYGNCHGTAIGW